MNSLALERFAPTKHVVNSLQSEFLIEAWGVYCMASEVVQLQQAAGNFAAKLALLL